MRLCLLLGVGWSTSAIADGDPLAALKLVDSDPLELARVVDGLETDAVVSALAKPASVRQKLTLIRAAPWVDGPHRTLLALATLMSGRDSLLAPAAAAAVSRIIAGLDAESLLSREVLPAELEPARLALAAVTASKLVRADIRAVAAVAVGAFDHWLGPLPARDDTDDATPRD